MIFISTKSDNLRLTDSVQQVFDAQILEITSVLVYLDPLAKLLHWYYLLHYKIVRDKENLTESCVTLWLNVNVLEHSPTFSPK